MPFMNLTIAIAHVNLTDCFSAALLGVGNRSADSRECRRWMKEGHDGEERYKLIYQSSASDKQLTLSFSHQQQMKRELTLEMAL